MKYAFIINPIAGNGKKADKLCKEISAAALDSEFDIELHYTTGPGSATHIFTKKQRSRDWKKLSVTVT